MKLPSAGHLTRGIDVWTCDAAQKQPSDDVVGTCEVACEPPSLEQAIMEENRRTTLIRKAMNGQRGEYRWL